jgi:acetyl esterase
MLGALLIRVSFEIEGRRTRRALERHRVAGIGPEPSRRYSTLAGDCLLDVYRRRDLPGRRPVLVWIHGGGWLSGHRGDAAGYFTLLADAGYTVVSVGYSRAPGARYPTPVRQIAAALEYLVGNADGLDIDPGRFALAGDSAGAQLASQLAAMITDPEFAAEVGVRPGLKREALKAVILHCGIYDMRRFLAVDDLPSRLLRWGVRQTFRAYTGTLDAEGDVARQMSTLDHVSADFPPTFISGGNGDRLTETQSRPLATALRAAGVEVEELFFSADREPALGHEYQFDLDDEAGQQALRRSLAFLARHLAD